MDPESPHDEQRRAATGEAGADNGSRRVSSRYRAGAFSIRFTRTTNVFQVDFAKSDRAEHVPRRAKIHDAEASAPPFLRLLALCTAFANYGIAILSAVYVPILVQIIIYRVRGITLDPVGLSIEFYSLSFGIAVALYAELRIIGERAKPGPIMIFYREILHWIAPFAALACLLSVVVLSVDPTSYLGLVLSKKPTLVIPLAFLLYAAYKVPTLWASTGVAEQPMDDDAEERVHKNT